MSNSSDFIIENGVLKKYVGPGGEVVIPEGVTEIGASAFTRREDITGVMLPEGIKMIGKTAFYRCWGLTGITIPEGVIGIGDTAFGYCNGLEVVSLPASLQKIGKAIFDYCGKCSFSIPEWKTELTTAVKNCVVTGITTENITKVPAKYRPVAALAYVTDQNVQADSFRTKNHLAYLEKNVDKLCDFSFEHPELLRYLCEHKLIKPANVDLYVQEAVKRDDVELKALILEYQNSLDEFSVMAARERKEKAAESYAEALTDRLTSRDLTKGIAGLTFVITGEMEEWRSRGEIKEWLESYGAKLGASVTKMTDYLVTNTAASNSEKGKAARELGVMVIDETEFNVMVGRRFRNEETVIVPQWLRTIYKGAFAHNGNTITIILPEGIDSIGENAFSMCRKLQRVEIPESVKSIGNFAFYECADLTDVTIAKSVSIGESAFTGCKNLADADGFVIVGGILFNYYGSAENVVLPDGVTAINRMAFWGRGTLKSVIVPSSVKRIGGGAFQRCSNLIAVSLPAEIVISDEEDVFWDCPNLTIHAPAGSVAEQYAKENNIPFVAEE